MSQRKEDIPEIVASLLPGCCQRANVRVAFDEIPSDFIEALCDSPPPGNIRGLEQQLQRLLLFCPKDRRDRPILSQWRTISGLSTRSVANRRSKSSPSMEDLLDRPFDVTGSPRFSGLPSLLEGITRRVIQDARSRCTSDRKAADLLGITPSALSMKVGKLGLAKARPATGERPGLVSVRHNEESATELSV